MALLSVQHKHNMFLKSLTFLTFRYAACDDPAINQLYKRNKFFCTFILMTETFTKSVESVPLEKSKKSTTCFI